MSGWLETLVEWLWWLIELVVYWIMAPGRALVDGVAGAWPAFAGDSGVINQYLGFMDYWVDTELIIDAYVTYLLFWSVVTAYKLIKSWIPTVSAT